MNRAWINCTVKIVLTCTPFLSPLRISSGMIFVALLVACSDGSYLPVRLEPHLFLLRRSIPPVSPSLLSGPEDDGCCLKSDLDILQSPQSPLSQPAVRAANAAGRWASASSRHSFKQHFAPGWETANVRAAPREGRTHPHRRGMLWQHCAVDPLRPRTRTHTQAYYKDP